MIGFLAERRTARPDGRVEYHFRPDPSGRTSWVTDGTGDGTRGTDGE